MAELVFPPQIEAFSLARATHLASYTIHLQMIKRWKEDPIGTIPLVSAALQEYESRFELFDQNYKLSQKSDLTAQIREEDDARDNALTQFGTILRAHAKVTLKAYAEPAELLLDKFEFYGIDPKMQIDQENALILNWSKDMAEDRYAQALDQLGLRPLYDDLLTRTDRLRTLISARTDESSSKEPQSLKLARQNCDDAYRYLILCTNAVIVTSPSPSDYSAFVQRINGDIKYHRQKTLKA